ncbi:aldehyde dehydrogenase [Desarmillaria tabescens]|uniref:Aldehyde dehydrogenase n=1 Tax=Armillaria tabescens TaxID=1929756 RepID=A0AA39N8P1_ARMTA|nr:aldehyde dehydrogenase [Desarmillaria tabescens]KAK0461058.1 aldehyde dehydrogenase [Desarmillaria tabescens]
MATPQDLPFTPLFVNGEWKPSKSGSTFEVRNPYSGAVSGISASATIEDCREVVDSAYQAFLTWENTDYSVRQNIFLKAAQIVASERYMHQVQEAIAAETAATPDWSYFNWAFTQNYLLSAATMVRELKGEAFPSAAGGHVMVQRRPVGVILGIAPWNAPFVLSIRAVMVPIVCGNTVILKSSEYSPRTQALVAELFHEAGLPKGVLNFVSMSQESSPEVTANIIANPKIRMLNFTGSHRVGRILAQEAGKHLKPCVFELGGKSPTVVLNDADIEQAAKAIVYAAMDNAGQVCMSAERVIVQRDVSKALINAVVQMSKKLTAGHPSTNPLPPLFTEGSAENIVGLIRQAVESGAELLLGDIARDGAVVQPHILCGVDTKQPLWRQEAFGPVTTFAVCDTIDEAVELANDSDYTLSAALWTSSLESAMSVAPKIRSGFTNINGSTFHSERFFGPYGLGGSSGYGEFDVEHFTQKRGLVFHAPGRKYSLVENVCEKK